MSCFIMEWSGVKEASESILGVHNKLSCISSIVRKDLCVCKIQWAMNSVLSSSVYRMSFSFLKKIWLSLSKKKKTYQAANTSPTIYQISNSQFHLNFVTYCKLFAVIGKKTLNFFPITKKSSGFSYLDGIIFIRSCCYISKWISFSQNANHHSLCNLITRR